ncbi:hypothetical protein [Lysinibacillus xylanilyticus]
MNNDLQQSGAILVQGIVPFLVITFKSGIAYLLEANCPVNQNE